MSPSFQSLAPRVCSKNPRLSLLQLGMWGEPRALFSLPRRISLTTPRLPGEVVFLLERFWGGFFSPLIIIVVVILSRQSCQLWG